MVPKQGVAVFANFWYHWVAFRYQRFSSKSLRSHLPAVPSGNTQYQQKEFATQWNKEQLSGSTTLKAMDSSLVRTAKMYSFTSRQSSHRVSGVSKRVRPYSST